MIFVLIRAVACTPAGSKYNLDAANSFLPVKFSKGARGGCYKALCCALTEKSRV